MSENVGVPVSMLWVAMFDETYFILLILIAVYMKIYPWFASYWCKEDGGDMEGANKSCHLHLGFSGKYKIMSIFRVQHQ